MNAYRVLIFCLFYSIYSNAVHSSTDVSIDSNGNIDTYVDVDEDEEGYEYIYEGDDSGYMYVYYDDTGTSGEMNKYENSQHVVKEVEFIISSAEKQQQRQQQQQQQQQQQPEMPKRKNGFQLSYSDGLPVITNRLLYDNKWRILNETSTHTSCYSKYDPRGSRANNTEEMQLLSSLKQPPGDDKDDDAGRRKLSLKEIQEVKMRQRVEEAKLKEKMHIVRKIQLGSDCEALLCESCRIMIEEFSNAVVKASTNVKYEYIEQVLHDFCIARDIASKYNDLIGTVICQQYIEKTTDYKKLFISVYEDDTDYANMGKYASISAKVEKICNKVLGACFMEQLQFVTDKVYRYQENWDDKCFTCQYIADNIESRVSMYMKANENDIKKEISSICNRLLPSSDSALTVYHNICTQMINSDSIDEIVFIAKIHYDLIMKKSVGEVRFSDKMCQELTYCEKWLTESERKAKLSPVTVPVFE